MKRLQKKIKEQLIFLNSMAESKEIGAIIPTSRKAASAMVAELKRHRGPKRILEVGAGTGPVTQVILDALGPNDTFVVNELNEGFIKHLQGRFEQEALFREKAHQCEVVGGSFLDINEHEKFDFIISALPFNSLPYEFVKEAFAKYQRLLKPGGALTYIEYIFIRPLLKQFSKGERQQRICAIDRFLEPTLERYQFRKEFVLANVPPCWVRSLRFTQAPLNQLKSMVPYRDRNAVSIGNFRMAQEGIPITLASFSSTLLTKRWGWVGIFLSTLLTGVIAWFHRDPCRSVQQDPDWVLSACDGTVLRVEPSRHPRLPGTEWTRVVTFLSPLDVHINRSPVAGRVTETWSEGIGYRRAFEEDAEKNATVFMLLETEHGPVAVAQRAGTLARTIYCWPLPGELLTQGERYGLIRFGSRTDVYLPTKMANILVQEGDKLVSGQTPIAKIVKRT